MKPKGIDDIGAAGILYTGLTAWCALYIHGNIGGSKGAKTSKGGGKGKHLCILGASGGVGSLVVQMAKAEGMIITATCSTNSVEMVKELGADYIVNYAKDDIDEKFRDQFFDVILDCAGLGSPYATKLPWKFSQYITLTSPMANNIDSNGIFLGSMKSGWNLLKYNVQTIYGHEGVVKWGYFRPEPQGIEYFKNLVENGKLKPITDSVYEFSSMKEAFEKMAKGHVRGKIIVKVKKDL